MCVICCSAGADDSDERRIRAEQRAGDAGEIPAEAQCSEDKIMEQTHTSHRDRQHRGNRKWYNDWDAFGQRASLAAIWEWADTVDTPAAGEKLQFQTQQRSDTSHITHLMSSIKLRFWCRVFVSAEGAILSNMLEASDTHNNPNFINSSEWSISHAAHACMFAKVSGLLLGVAFGSGVLWHHQKHRCAVYVHFIHTVLGFNNICELHFCSWKKRLFSLCHNRK